MDKLTQLRDLIKEMFDKAEDKTEIDTLSKLNKVSEEAIEEQNQLINKNAELIKDYKDLVQHTSFKDNGKVSTDPVTAQPISFEQALQEFLNK